jgi:hypothetical protein
VLIRADSGGGTQDFLAWLAKPGRRLAYSVGFTITEDIQQAILTIPALIQCLAATLWPDPENPPMAGELQSVLPGPGAKSRHRQRPVTGTRCMGLDAREDPDVVPGQSGSGVGQTLPADVARRPIGQIGASRRGCR